MARTASLSEVLSDAIALAQAQIHTALPARVVAVHGAVVDVQPVIQAVVNDVPVTLPIFPGVPLYWPSGFAGPVAAGDYCLLIVAERALDGWWIGQDGIPPVEERMHDYSDCIALAGIRPAAAGVTIPAYPTAYGAQVHLGAAAPADAVAVGSRVLAELQALRNTVNAMVTVFNAHVHPIIGAVPVEPGVPPTSSASAVPQVAPAAVGPVASTVVKIPGGVA